MPNHKTLGLLFSSVAAAVAVTLTPSPALAHGPQIQLTNDGGKIVTRRLFLDGPYNEGAASPATSVYVMPLAATAVTVPDGLGGTVTQTWAYAKPADGSASGPGLAYGHGATGSATLPPTYNPAFPYGSKFTWSFTDTLKRWDGSAFVDDGPEQLDGGRYSGTSLVAGAKSTDAGPFQGFDLPVAAPTGNAAAVFDPHALDAHTSARFRLLGDGTSPAAAGRAGIYLASLKLTTDAPGIAASEPFQFVVYQGVGLDAVASVVASQFGARAAAGQVQFVPEPGAVGAVVMAGGGLLARRRRPLAPAARTTAR